MTNLMRKIEEKILHHEAMGNKKKIKKWKKRLKKLRKACQ